MVWQDGVPPSDWIDPKALGWPAPAHVRAVITTRAGGVSLGDYASLNLSQRVGDDAVAVTENRRRLRTVLPQEPVWLRQVHGTTCIDAGQVARASNNAKPDAVHNHEPAAEPEADASYTVAPGTVCTIGMADCMPVLMCDRAGTRVGVAHAGWKGLCAGVVENLLDALLQAPGPQVKAQDMLVFLGPCIGPERFEVGEDVLHAFTQADPAAARHFAPRPHLPGTHLPRKYLADLYALARQRLARRGVTAIFGGGFCTLGDTVTQADGSTAPRFFSYRREKRSGRMGAFVWLES
jgi:polyphenol oxidase